MRTKLLNDKGVALVTVVLFFLVLVILLAGVMFASVSNQGNAIISREHTNSYFSAESGMNVTLEKLVKHLSNGYSEFPAGNYAAKRAALEAYILGLNNRTDVMDGINLEGNYLINVVKVDDVTYTLRSTGTFNNISRVVEGTFKFDPILEDLMKAVLAKNSIDNVSGGGGTINGEIASLMQTAGSFVKVSGCSIGNVYVPPVPGLTESNVNAKNEDCNDVMPINHPVTFQDSFDFSPYNDTASNLMDVVVNGNVYTFPELQSGKVGYKIATIPSGNLVFDLGTGANDRIIELYIDDLNTTSNSMGSINVIGNGKLAIIVKVDKVNTTGNPKYFFNWGWNVNNNPILNDLTKFQLVLRKGSDFPANVNPTFTIPNGNTFIGSILGDDINVELGNMIFKGYVATLGSNITLTSNGLISGPMWIFAPKATVKVESGVVINGAIMADSVYLTSNSTVNYLTLSGEPPFKIVLPVVLGGAPIPVGIDFKFINFREV